MIRTTTKEFAERLGVEYQVAAGLLRYLKEKGLAKIVETRPNPSGKGKGSDVYELPTSIALEF
jgi:transcription initiation factor IIE alpha subunit